MNQSLLDRLYVSLPNGLGRNISTNVIVKRLTLPEMSPALHTSWVEAVLDANPMLWPGTVLGTAIEPPPDFGSVLANWMAEESLSLEHTLLNSRLLACEGSMFHHDTDHAEYQSCAFSALWLEDDAPWDLVFPLTGLRIPLEQGTVVMFDTANIHGVVKRGAEAFCEDDFAECGFQMFFSTDHQYTSASLRAKMGVEIYPENHFSGRASLQRATSSSDKFCPFTGRLSL